MNDLDYDEEPSPEILQNAKASRENLNEKKKFLDIQSNKEKSEAKPVNINSRRSSNVNNYSLHTANKENDNSYDIHIDTSIKPKKGDKTPKSGGSLNEKLNENKNCDVSNDKIKTSQSQLHSNSQMYSNCNVQNCSKDFNQYDLQQLSYDLQKEYSHLRLDKNESFIERMNFDIFKRQTKEERLEKLIERNKVKIDEEERIKTFNRLIEDANRRLEAQEHLEEMKQKLEEDPLLVEPKKYRDEEWDDIYNDRFKKFQDEKDKKLDYKIKEKREIERLKEDEIVETVKTKKAPRYIIDQASKRMYDEAQRRKLKYENMKKDSGAEDDPSQKVSEKERELTPSKFKKFKIEHKYNFMSDNENSGDDKFIKQENVHATKKKNSPKVSQKQGQQIYKPNLNKRTSNKDKSQYQIKTIKEETPITKKKNKIMNKEGIFKMSHAIDEDNSQHNKDDDLEEDESIRNIPKPEEREHFNQVCPIRSSDLKNISYNKGISQLNIQSTMNDIEADRLVDQILRGKFANLN